LSFYEDSFNDQFDKVRKLLQESISVERKLDEIGDLMDKEDLALSC